MNTAHRNADIPYITKARARRLEAESITDSKAHRDAGRCDCSLPHLPGETRCTACKTAHRKAVSNAFGGL
ncbi:MAG: hypothetical protein EKK62_12880 [Acidimicrobiia bacterium]|nr:MAG: hypothetical protein EKK62_12880 [Acidimicrobiia bacterium]